jgi:hypothetical protein
MTRNRKSTILTCLIIVIALALIFKLYNVLNLNSCPSSSNTQEAAMVREEKSVISSDQHKYVYNRELPLIFIGGVPRSGMLSFISYSYLNKVVLLIFVNKLLRNNGVFTDLRDYLDASHARCTSGSALWPGD